LQQYVLVPKLLAVNVGESDCRRSERRQPVGRDPRKSNGNDGVRDIKDILLFRTDVSPFLAHLTREADGETAHDRLHRILTDGQLIAGQTPISTVRFGGNTAGWTQQEKRRWFGAVCFTETPLGEAHCLLDIQGRTVNLEPYGILFVKDLLASRGVAPAIYLNNAAGAADDLVAALFSLKETHAEAARRLLPLVTAFGLKIRPPNVADRVPGQVDFYWEREWRYPADLGPFTFGNEDVFCGLCPHEHIEEFEDRYRPIKFIDPRRNIKWYAQSLIASRQRLQLRNSVV
jgi:hypothetical protein